MGVNEAIQVPTVTIYQDPSYIEGILQQSNRGLLTAGSHETDNQSSATFRNDNTGEVGVKANVAIPAIGSVGGNFQFSGGDASSLENATIQKMTQNFEYTTAFYLHHVRQNLQAKKLLKDVKANFDVQSLKVGEFIEFQAEFRPDEIISLIDVLNPEVVAELARWLRRNKILAKVANARSKKEKEDLEFEYKNHPEADAQIARAVAEAIRIDFRSAATRQYYGDIDSSDEVTAVVVCDSASFLIEDADRILDGNFTVLGKVSTIPQVDVPVLERNKLLDRIQPAAVDQLTDLLRTLASKQIGNLGSISSAQTLEKYLDLDFPSRIDGTSFKVIPIAIYI